LQPTRTQRGELQESNKQIMETHFEYIPETHKDRPPETLDGEKSRVKAFAEKMRKCVRGVRSNTK